jgi:hypothetical protein
MPFIEVVLGSARVRRFGREGSCFGKSVVGGEEDPREVG